MSKSTKLKYPFSLQMSLWWYCETATHWACARVLYLLLSTCFTVCAIRMNMPDTPFWIAFWFLGGCASAVGAVVAFRRDEQVRLRCVEAKKIYQAIRTLEGLNPQSLDHAQTLESD